MSENVHLPVGAIIMYKGDPENLPTGWRVCDGKDGRPDLKDRFIVGAGNEYKLGDRGGLKEVVLSVQQIPPHNHSINNGDFGIHVRSFEGKNDNDRPFKTNADTKLGTDDTGGGKSHENRPPYYALYYIIRTS